MSKKFSSVYRYLALIIIGLSGQFIYQRAFAGGPSCSEIFKNEIIHESVQVPETLRLHDPEFSQGMKKRLANASFGQAGGKPPISIFNMMEKDPSQGMEKLKYWRKLGFSSSGKVPTWSELYLNYKKEMALKGIDITKYGLRPGLVLYRKMDNSPFDEYIVVDPFTEPLPGAEQQFKVFTFDTGRFNLPFKVMAKALSEGKWPLIDSAHDVSHFVAFMRYPRELAEPLVQIFRKKKQADFTPGFKRRLFWLIENMTFPDESKKSVMSQFFSDHSRNPHAKSVEEIRRDLARMNDRSLAEYALALSHFYETILADFSGAQSFSREKLVDRASVFFKSDYINAFEDVQSDTSSAIDIAKQLIGTGRIEHEFFEINPTSIETSRLNFDVMNKSLNILAKSLLNEKDHSASDLAGIVRELASRIEYSCVRAMNDISIETFVNGFLQRDLSPDSQLGLFLSDVFSTETLPAFYLGTGQSRRRR